MKRDFKQRIFKVDDTGFNGLAMDIFYYQAKNNPVYSQFLQLIDIRPENIYKPEQIPFLPIELFKSHTVACSELSANTPFFSSSSTTGIGVSRHYVPDPAWYNDSVVQCFEYFFGSVEDFTFRFLLPSYLERKGSSLVQMANHLLTLSGKGGFYLDDFEKLARDLESDKKHKSKVMVLGVSFALLDFADLFPMDLSGMILMETGGMKGRREEIIREELHQHLIKNLNLQQVSSEYGMTELFSQAYALKDGQFRCPPWMKVSVGQTTDPFGKEKSGKTGTLNIMDLSNIDGCCFIATSDLGRVYENETFEVLGRYDQSDVRGCNLLY